MSELHIPSRFRAIELPRSHRHLESFFLGACLFLFFVTVGALALLAYIRADAPGYDFCYYLLAGKMWSNGLSPYGASFHEAGLSLITSGHVPSIWPYPPNMWRPSVGFALFDLTTAWRVLLGLQLVALLAASAALAFVLPTDKLPGLGGRSIRLTRFGFFLLHVAFVASLGSRLINRQSQNKTVAARAMAERNTFGHLS